MPRPTTRTARPRAERSAAASATNVSLRVMIDPPAPAAWNLAVDDALLQLATEPTLRLYGWRPHAVSIGWFQRIADFADLPPGTTIVRRPTGGGAIHHGDELTFALALDAALLPGDVAAGYRLLHDAAIRALADVGVAAARHAAGAAAAARPAARWCFATPGRDDVVAGGGKLLGSAQRRLRTDRPRLLHHGSLVLQRPPLTPFAAAVADTVVVQPALVARLQAALVQQLAAALQLPAYRGVLRADEIALARRLERERYADAAHLRAR